MGNEDTGKGKRMSRIANSMPYWKFTRMIEYKAEEKGLRVVKVKKSDTSKTCHKCGSGNNTRPAQGKFTCNACDLGDYNTDLTEPKTSYRGSSPTW